MKFTPLTPFGDPLQVHEPQLVAFTKRLPPGRLPRRYHKDHFTENHQQHQNDFYKNPQQWMQERLRISKEMSASRQTTLEDVAAQYFKGNVDNAREALVHAGWPSDVTMHGMHGMHGMHDM
jgi:hypothetical protein